MNLLELLLTKLIEILICQTLLLLVYGNLVKHNIITVAVKLYCITDSLWKTNNHHQMHHSRLNMQLMMEIDLLL